jgi:uncharacterized protein YjbI with pentapeptide repeats
VAKRPERPGAATSGGVEEPKPGRSPSANDVAVKEAGELLATANGESGSARNAWIAFLALIAYLLVTLAGVTDRDVLVNSGHVQLPIVNINIPLVTFFVVAPFLLMLVHGGLLMQHVMVAHKFHEFTDAIARSEKGKPRSHPSRRLVNGYVFAQLLAGPRPSALLEFLMRAMIWGTLAALPVFTLLYFQIQFLRYHDVLATYSQRAAILLDIVLLFVVWPFFHFPPLCSRWPRVQWVPEYPRRRIRHWLRVNRVGVKLGPRDWRWRMSWAAFSVGVGAFIVLMFFSSFVVTVPDSALDRATAAWMPSEVIPGRTPRPVFSLTKLLFEGDPDAVTRQPQSLFARNIVVSNVNVVADSPGVSFRGRDLRHANLAGSDLHGADFSASWLQDASFGEADLQGAIFRSFHIQRANFNSAVLQDADFTSAVLEGATFDEANLQGAKLRSADLEGASFLGETDLRGADLSSAFLNGARFGNVDLRGANLRAATMQGLVFRNANLQGADLREADLRDANLSGADLRGADLRGANLRRANLSGADLRGSDLREAKVWLSTPPPSGNMWLASLATLAVEPEPDPESWAGRPGGGWEALAWPDSHEHRAWTDVLEASHRPRIPSQFERDVFLVRLAGERADFLANLACEDAGAPAYLAQALVKRVVDEGFDGDQSEFHRKFRACDAARKIQESLASELARLPGHGTWLGPPEASRREAAP